MTLNQKRRRAHEKLAALPGVRPVRRPVTPGGSGEFDLYYVRSGRKTQHPVVIIPGGPGWPRSRCTAAYAGGLPPRGST